MEEKVEDPMEKQRLQVFERMFISILGEELPGEAVLAVAEGGDEVDAFTQEKAQQMSLRLRSRSSVYLKKVKYALHKIHSGTFGTCEDCGGEISEARLMARPTATLCIYCKEDEERGDRQLVHGNRHSVKFGGGNAQQPLLGRSPWRTNGEDRTGTFSLRVGEPELDPTAG